MSVAVVASITLANGGDNIGVHTPLFARRPHHELATIFGVFAVLAVVWCLVALRVARLPLVARAVERWGHSLAPWILMGLGVYVFVHADTWTVLFHGEHVDAPRRRALVWIGRESSRRGAARGM